MNNSTVLFQTDTDQTIYWAQTLSQLLGSLIYGYVLLVIHKNRAMFNVSFYDLLINLGIAELVHMNVYNLVLWLQYHGMTVHWLYITFWMVLLISWESIVWHMMAIRL